MREILFRAKPNNSNEWVYGDLTSHRSVSPKNGKFIHCKDEVTGSWGNFRVKYETIGQYTGLCDKNGTKIFEGDIVTFNNQIGMIVYEEGCFGIGLKEYINYESLSKSVREKTTNYYNGIGCDNFIALLEIYWNFNDTDNYIEEVEIIGTIHDNSHLLKGE